MIKKLSILFMSALALLSLYSCEDEKKPVFTNATSFELNTPALQDQYYELTSDGTFEIVCKSQPDFGAPMGPTQYSGQVSLTSDFSSYQEIKPVNTSSKMIFNDSDLAQSICKLKGLTKDDEGYVFAEPMIVYFRATCAVKGVENSTVTTSNYVTLNKVMPYFALPTPGYIYLVGQPEGWAGPSAAAADHYAEWRLFEEDDAIGSKIYFGTFQINQGEAMFRFYTALTGWDNDSYGSQADDNPKDFTIAESPYTMVKGKGAYNITDWPGGEMMIKVDMSNPANMTVTVTPAQ